MTTASDLGRRQALDTLPPPEDLSFSGAGNLYATHAQRIQ